LGDECVDGAARGELSGSPAKLLLDSTSTSRFRAARPVTFFVLPKKVTKERRAYKDAEQRSAGRGIWPSTVRSTWLAPQARDRASFDGHRPARAAQGTGEAGAFAGASFFAYFLWQDKESRGPRGPEVRPGRKTISPARSASNPIAPGERSARAPAC
jgi:hypothetical protein